jgi:AcrR family transcriptional regulator
MLMSVGVTSMTMDTVAHACGISKRTLYEVFPDKRTLITECLKHNHEVKNAEVKAIFDHADNCFDAMFKVYSRAKAMYENTSVAFVNGIKRLYPEQEARAEFPLLGPCKVYAYGHSCGLLELA